MHGHSGDEDSRDEHSSDLGELLQHLARRLRRAAANELEPLGITVGQARALRVLERAGRPVQMHELARLLDVAPRSATSVVDQLCAGGFVRRDPDPDDRRATLVALTRKGSQVRARLRVGRRAATEALVGRLGPADRAELERLLLLLSQGS